MAKFLFSYRMSNDYAPGGTDVMAAWTSWFGDLGSAILDPGNPTFEATPLGNCSADTHVGGYTVVQAEDLESAVTLAKGCPALSQNGGVEVGVITEIM